MISISYIAKGASPYSYIVFSLLAYALLAGCSNPTYSTLQEDDEDAKVESEFPVETLRTPAPQFITEDELPETLENLDDGLYQVSQVISAYGDRFRELCREWSTTITQRLESNGLELFVEASSFSGDDQDYENECVVYFTRKEAFDKTALGYVLSNLPPHFQNPWHAGADASLMSTRLKTLATRSSRGTSYDSLYAWIYVRSGEFVEKGGHLGRCALGTYEEADFSYLRDEASNEKKGIVMAGGSYWCQYDNHSGETVRTSNGYAELSIYHEPTSLDGEESGRFWYQYEKEGKIIPILLKPAE